MSISIAKHPLAAPLAPLAKNTGIMSRPQVGIERLPAHAVPKKRGPKTDVLEALLKRVDGLEQKLKNQKKTETGDDAGAESSEATFAAAVSGSGISPASIHSPGSTPNLEDATEVAAPMNVEVAVAEAVTVEQPAKQPKPQTGEPSIAAKDDAAQISSQQPQQGKGPAVQVDALLHTYFTRSHAKPFHILDESSFRQRLRSNRIPSYLLGSVCALAARYTPHPNGYLAAVRLGEQYAMHARAEMDVDEPSIDCLQTLLLLALAFVASGKGKKAFMLLSTAIGMAVALELHREMDSRARILPVEREMRRRLMWTCYLLDRFMACGSKRPSLIHDSMIFLRLPSCLSSSTQTPVDGDFFQTASNMQYIQNGGGKRLQGGSGLLIDISRILGITNQYLAAGGVKGDSHFPWHSLSNLSKIRQNLDSWASSAQDIFSSIETLFSQPDATVLVMSKLIYHLIHCLIYRPFLPIDLAELAGAGQHQSWQIEATNMCFMHANAIAELTELGKRMPQVEWPGFVGYCICTAGTVHVHGAHYNRNAAGSEMGLFAASAEFLAREMQHMAEMRHAWACVQHHRLTLQKVYHAHTELVNVTARNVLRHSFAFQLEDFFDRYTNIGGPGGLSFNFDPSNLILADVVVDFTPDAAAGSNLYTSIVGARDTTGGFESSNNGNSVGQSTDDNSAMDVVMTDQQSHKKKKMRPPILGLKDNGATLSTEGSRMPSTNSLQAPAPQDRALPGGPFFNYSTTNVAAIPSTINAPLPQGNSSFGDPSSLSLEAQMAIQHDGQVHSHQQAVQQQQHKSPPPPTPFSPGYNFSFAGSATASNPGPAAMAEDAQYLFQGSFSHSGNHVELSGYDPMFATMPTNAFPSPSPWTMEDAGSGEKANAALPKQSPSGRSNDGSAGGPTSGEEKDPFLSLLEQLADNEYTRGPGNELDFFLAGTTDPA
ncbi:hypothetical protein SEPCBS119000_002766 [Sporothrix epigloea]|uniref:Xylanolytic transcriptional activator regulatory domain-containing protein n=1 Tax=Sporothrix epigloea TaxID=1892477 RepID=A0ABP0DHX2_9PEZI